ncbi:ExbD/TolR family protein [Marinoscillum sp.]|uniref:ExbD/TolR family protein n=1 Tax=Marinoscillum sp. TaxID=2024838 RepID=UPI003BA9462D
MRFKTKTKFQNTEISTASLPDIVFLLLFFFMVSATIKPVDEQVTYKTPQALAITSVDQKTLIREISIGHPQNTSLGDQDVISVANQIIRVDQIAQWAIEQKETLPEALKDQMIVVIKADEFVKMGLISDVQEELKKANARKVVYRARPEATQ